MTVQPYTVRVVLRTGEIRLTLAAQSPHEALRLAEGERIRAIFHARRRGGWVR